MRRKYQNPIIQGAEQMQRNDGTGSFTVLTVMPNLDVNDGVNALTRRMPTARVAHSIDTDYAKEHLVGTAIKGGTLVVQELDGEYKYPRLDGSTGSTSSINAVVFSDDDEDTVIEKAMTSFMKDATKVEAAVEA